MNSAPKYSVIIAVYNSKSTLALVVNEVLNFFKRLDATFEIILVNDGSQDGSWNIAEQLCADFPQVVAIDLTRNCGQHTALFCGFQFARGQAAITLDDDLQNPAGEISKLISKAAEGYDLVLGRYAVKQHSLYRRIGSRVIQRLLEKIFNKPRDLVMTNFRLVDRSIVDRVKVFRGLNPYLPGLIFAASARAANVTVEHRPSEQLRSRYTLLTLLELVGRLLFQYSIFPLRVLVLIGGAISVAAFSLSSFFFIRGCIYPSRAVGWTSLVVLISFFSGFIILLLWVLGEYLLRVVSYLNHPEPYFVRKLIRNDR